MPTHTEGQACVVLSVRTDLGMHSQVILLDTGISKHTQT